MSEKVELSRQQRKSQETREDLSGSKENPSEKRV